MALLLVLTRWAGAALEISDESRGFAPPVDPSRAGGVATGLKILLAFQLAGKCLTSHLDRAFVLSNLRANESVDRYDCPVAGVENPDVGRSELADDRGTPTKDHGGRFLGFLGWRSAACNALAGRFDYSTEAVGQQKGGPIEPPIVSHFSPGIGQRANRWSRAVSSWLPA